jgi:hypothetical protein
MDTQEGSYKMSSFGVMMAQFSGSSSLPEDEKTNGEREQSSGPMELQA